jgi:hypothetical protein
MDQQLNTLKCASTRAGLNLLSAKRAQAYWVQIKFKRSMASARLINRTSDSSTPCASSWATTPAGIEGVVGLLRPRRGTLGPARCKNVTAKQSGSDTCSS